jgi:hypothetical protein
MVERTTSPTARSFMTSIFMDGRSEIETRAAKTTARVRS